MNRRIVGTLLLAGLLCSGPAFAAQNVANTSQKGSLLMFPLIDVRAENGANTLIEISNDQSLPVEIECSYINEKKGRVDFDFGLTPKQTVSWEVLTGNGSIAAPLFPSDGTFSGDPAEGELICFAVSSNLTAQIAFNHLTGTATVVSLDDTDARLPQQALRYNAWAFAARCTVNSTTCPAGLAGDNTVQGPPGDLVLSGNGDGTYDSCPLYNIANFNPNGATESSSAGPVLTTLDNDLAVISCDQDLRQDFTLNLTKLQFTVWNANENSFTGSYQCVDSVDDVGLSNSDNLSLKAATNFDFSVLRTANARFMVQGVRSTQCAGSAAAGLVGVLTSSVGLGSDTTEDQEIGSTTQGAGTEAGFVLWDPASPTPFLRIGK